MLLMVYNSKKSLLHIDDGGSPMVFHPSVLRYRFSDAQSELFQCEE